MLWVVVILSSFVAAGAYAVRLGRSQSYYALRDIQLAGAAAAAVERVKAELSRDNSGYDSVSENWKKGGAFNNMAVAPASVDVTVTDEESKININTSSLEILLRLMAGIPNREEVVDSILDWRDADMNVRENGGEESWYQQLDSPVHCKNKFFDCLEELYLVKGIRGKRTVTSLFPVMTVRSNGRININTAPYAVLVSLPGMNAENAGRVIARRNGSDGIEGTEDDLPFRSEGEMREVVTADVYGSCSGMVTVSSSLFTVKVVARLGHASKVVEALLKRDEHSISTIYWRELS